ncbi:FliI/YscN family ATPase [Bartonella bilalgolemii]|uniref:Flagellar protein export ATPase FliI n=1 Tax=Bartonella bilalgolemii TaxID=2942911 RepID=A0ABT0P7I9_9HYPH|nr:FliI/YscN family ATPase [Bartonella sp. G70]MCL6229444.1 flagellar protein export ATPase FliI [Bartonella sp. G70]
MLESKNGSMPEVVLVNAMPKTDTVINSSLTDAKDIDPNAEESAGMANFFKESANADIIETTPSPTALTRLLDFAKRKNDRCSHLVSQGGVISDVARGTLVARGLSQSVLLGDTVCIECDTQLLRGEIIRVNEESALIKPYDETVVPILSASVFPKGPLFVAPDRSWCGRIVNAFGEAIDGKGEMSSGPRNVAIETYAPPALKRARVGAGLRTGVKVIDIFTPLCFGQRIGIFSGSGVGKSTLLSMMMQADHFDTVVLALTGERGREVRDMLDDILQDKLHKLIGVIATGDESPMMRRLAPIMATTIAEYFSSLGDNVLLVVDSITRYALAAREIAITAHEPPVSRGFPPRVFSELPRLLERAGPGREGKGSITGVYAVLVDGDDHNDPIADTIRGILDGHIVLDRAIAAQGRFPAVDILSSISRLASHSWTPEQCTLVKNLKEMIFRYEETRDLRAMGAYRPGTDHILDQAVFLVPAVYTAMKQNPDMPLIIDPYEELAKLLKSQ